MSSCTVLLQFSYLFYCVSHVLILFSNSHTTTLRYMCLAQTTHEIGLYVGYFLSGIAGAGVGGGGAKKGPRLLALLRE